MGKGSMITGKHAQQSRQRILLLLPGFENQVLHALSDSLCIAIEAIGEGASYTPSPHPMRTGGKTSRWH